MSCSELGCCLLAASVRLEFPNVHGSSNWLVNASFKQINKRVLEFVKVSFELVCCLNCLLLYSNGSSREFLRKSSNSNSNTPDEITGLLLMQSIRAKGNKIWYIFTPINAISLRVFFRVFSFDLLRFDRWDILCACSATQTAH